MAFVPSDYDEIAVKEGDILEVTLAYDDGWGEGLNVTTGERGMFPCAWIVGRLSEPSVVSKSSAMALHRGGTLYSIRRKQRARNSPLPHETTQQKELPPTPGDIQGPVESCSLADGVVEPPLQVEFEPGDDIANMMPSQIELHVTPPDTAPPDMSTATLVPSEEPSPLSDPATLPPRIELTDIVSTNLGAPLFPELTSLQLSKSSFLSADTETDPSQTDSNT
ncbi:hypothetical protein HDU93_005355, partial [Gonapodya sp. JEL0774]